MIILGNFHDIGAREIYEDRVQSAEFKTSGGLNLAVGIVADGVGGANKGERAAQLAIDNVLAYLRSSRETDVPILLSNAIQTANAKVHAEARQSGGASCTVAMAVIVNGETLYVANVGDSRVYLIRSEKLTQLTMDHSFANLMVMQGKMSRAAAEANQRAEVLMRALGPKPQIAVDIGFYVGTEIYQVAQERGRKGLPLKDGDSIIICSDGLIKNGPDGLPFTTEEEIVRTLNRQEGEKAARELVSFAIGRNADDNVSVATLQMPDPGRTMTLAKEQAAAAAARRKRTFGLVGVAAAIILALGAVIFGLNRSNRETQNEAEALAAEADALATRAVILEETREQRTLDDAQATEFAAFEETSIAQTTEAMPPTPTNTPRPTLAPLPTFAPGDIGVAYLQDTESSVQERQSVAAMGELTVIQIDDEQGDNRDLYASFYAHAGTNIFFDIAASQRMRLEASVGSDFYTDVGKYTGGIEIELDPDDDVLMTFNQCFSVQYSDDEVVANCYGGSCQVETPDETVSWEVGEQLVMDTQSFAAMTQPIPITQGMADRAFILGSADGEVDAQRCLNAAYEPTPTPIPPTPTNIIIPTFTPQSSSGASANSQTNTPRPTNTATQRPTNTPRPTNTATRRPTNTPVNTQQAATNTSIPTNTATPFPTNTPLPANTATPVPTNTPAPTNTPPPPPTNVPPTNTATLAPSPTHTHTPTLPPTQTHTPTPTSTNTSAPPTTEPPTNVPPTNAPPTNAPPTSPPPTEPPPTEPPPTPVLSTPLPPPTDPPPTNPPATEERP